MDTSFDWKKFEFNNAINRSLDDDAIKHRAEFSPVTVLYHMSEAFRAADMIPESITARDAAWDFTTWLISRNDPGAKMPDWFGPPTQKDYDRWSRSK